MGAVCSWFQQLLSGHSKGKPDVPSTTPANVESPHKPTTPNTATNVLSLSDTTIASANLEEQHPPGTFVSVTTPQHGAVVDTVSSYASTKSGGPDLPPPERPLLPGSTISSSDTFQNPSTTPAVEEAITYPVSSGDHAEADPLPSSSMAQMSPPCKMDATCTDPNHVHKFALVIGIDNYVNVTKLHGAVADAKAMEKYLKDILYVPEDHIRTLLDIQASRDAIIQAFKDLKEDKRIRKGDSIVIFYAGHGGERPTPRGWGPNNKIQCLYSQDFLPRSKEAIPDRTIGALLEDIAKEKGDNITVILDCCHSASGTRDPDKTFVPRVVRLDIDVPEDLDKNIWAPRAGSIAKGFAYHGLRSHVLLAACGEEELAYERNGRGQFTRELLERLRSSSNDLTYTELIERIPLEKQNPQCEGVNRHRVLFDTRVPAGRRVYHRANVNDGKCTIHAGLAHGVSVGVEFTLFSDRKLRLGLVRVNEDSSIGNFETTVTTSMDLSDVSFAKVTRIGTIPLYLAPGGINSALEEKLRQIESLDSHSQQFRLVRAEDAKMEVMMEDNQVTFNLLDPQARSFGLTKLPINATIDNLPHILDAAAHFFWYYDIVNHSFGTTDKVAVNFYSLKKEYDDFGMPYRIPNQPGFCQKDPDSDNSHVIDFVVDEKAVYGIEIKNDTSRDLYLNAFLFNNSSLSVVPYYTQSSAGNPEPPLKKGGTFTIGYGSGGAPPFSYSLENGQDIDVGYLKIFFATRPIDLTDIEQMSPFLDIHPPLIGDPRKGEPVNEAKLIDIWFTVQIPIVQRRKQN